MPTSAQMSSSEITVEFAPDLGAQFSGIGAVADLQVGDMDGDGIEDPIYLVQDHTAANGTKPTTFQVPDRPFTPRPFVAAGPVVAPVFVG